MNEENGGGNGHQNGQVYVRFGPGKTQEMPLEWAEKMLAEWRRKSRAQFGKALAEAAEEAD